MAVAREGRTRSPREDISGRFITLYEIFDSSIALEGLSLATMLLMRN
jgi:hypothetical protein